MGWGANLFCLAALLFLKLVWSSFGYIGHWVIWLNLFNKFLQIQMKIVFSFVSSRSSLSLKSYTLTIQTVQLGYIYAALWLFHLLRNFFYLHKFSFDNFEFIHSINFEVIRVHIFGVVARLINTFWSHCINFKILINWLFNFCHSNFLKGGLFTDATFAWFLLAYRLAPIH